MNKSMWIAIALSIGLLLWVLSGPGRSTSEVTQREDAPLMKVQVETVAAEFVDIKVKMQGELLPARSVVLRAETQGRIAAVDVDKAQPVGLEQTLLTIAMDDRAARLDEAKAEVLKAESDLEANRKLFKRGLLSASQLNQDEAKYASAKAQLSQIKNEIDHTRVKAPFDGIIDDRFVEVGDYVKSGDDLARVLDINTVKMTGWVPQQRAASLAKGQSVTTTLVNGETLKGVISYVAPQANTDTRAFKVEVTIKPESQIKLLGSSVSAEITTQRQKAHFLSASVISLGANGVLLVKAVTEDAVVESYPVDVIQSESSGLWLTGLPEQVTVITMGQGFVVDGQKVEPVVVGEESKDETATSVESTNSATEAQSQLEGA
ncbi:efflux RND transporter periplasmic adaptor subunit [Litoribrevibacter albus]|uniref:Hemolysin D n=1 Tax=Litoribrevibacter albus TaxID=1473156 RepID=A0AA37S7V8_9GAMM|nr:efflux RND transporter periplasmic adaptor subunit [Litoribrevibacter albus]GLQ29896.1 hemolysin D [Litoribrevibacter albus]